ncbi:predicted protein [Plenodomus lingam JN3]|uniref:Predicted protein n=1 Tax=Leptosphaeria maculans (strain JN3 / isolate v23.1.3 / race Av1-4-5-6-7-8) TaxID=985895 RepID=E4ZWF2_LEPMJ|nr:predicted protein [Plenodomus lingam JN3]CBX95928.1 predicted protein [Plenodomus lingam JN3]
MQIDSEWNIKSLSPSISCTTTYANMITSAAFGNGRVDLILVSGRSRQARSLLSSNENNKSEVEKSVAHRIIVYGPDKVASSSFVHHRQQTIQAHSAPWSLHIGWR